MLVESRLWFQALSASCSLVLTALCVVALYSLVQVGGASVQFALIALAIGAFSGFNRLLTLFLQIFLVRLWPSLERPAL